MRCDEFYKKWQRCGNFCEKHPSTASRIEKYLDQIEEMARVLTDSVKEEVVKFVETTEEPMQKEVIENPPVTQPDIPKEHRAPLPQNLPIGNFSEGSVRPLIKEKDEEIRHEAIRRSASLIERKEKEFGKEKANITEKDMVKIVEDVKQVPHITRASGEIEWYTPKEYVDAARSTMGGIDLDPASTDIANETIGASRFYTKEDDGLTHDWKGSVWMNPPYKSNLISDFVGKLCDEFDAGNVTEACVLVNNATETKWFQLLAKHASIILFPSSRIKFWYPDRDSITPLQGQAVLYLGDNTESFNKNFENVGVICWVIK